MAHYALLNENNIVIQVITGKNEDEVINDITDWEAHYSEVSGFNAKRTSYNTADGIHVLGGTPYRINYAGIGMTYDETLDGFIHPKPFASWVLNEQTGRWLSPTPYPTDDKEYNWNEETLSWVEIQE